MNQDSSLPPMLPPSTELGALLFALLPCLQEPYRPIASLAYHITELSSLKKIPSVPSFQSLTHPENFITDKDHMFRSLTYYGKMFRMPLLSTIATVLQALHFYNTYKDLFSVFFRRDSSSSDAPNMPFGNIGDLLAGLSGFSEPGGNLGNSFPDGFPTEENSGDFLSSLFSVFSGSSAYHSSGTSEENFPPVAESVSEMSPLPEEYPPPATEDTFTENDFPDSLEAFSEGSSDLYDNLYALLTPEQKEIYDKLMNTDETDSIG